MDNAHDRLLKRVAQAEARLTLIMQAEQGPELEDVLGVHRWRHKSLSRKAQQLAETACRNFRVPLARAYRLTNEKGETSFHFSHRFINKVAYETCEDGLRNRPNAARSHARYVERDAAVAQLPDGQNKNTLDEAALLETKTAEHGGAAEHDRYIGRADARAIRPDGACALITNIDAGEEERAKFWTLVEQHESVANSDEMSLRIADRPDFWARIRRADDCPAELRGALEEADPNDEIRFQIGSGKAMRRYLAKQPGWVTPGTSARRKKEGAGPEPFAKFHDGRKGRTQYRVIGELPDELSIEDRFSIVETFSQQFEKRRLPFVAVMHAPDRHNNERNWHFHLIYHDRPCRRITQRDIADLKDQGFSTDQLEPGMWDFTVVTPKRHRRNGRAIPLKQNKNRDVSNQGWIEMLRGELADITNDHLKAAGVGRRVDPRCFAEMGIPSDPQQHLGTKQAASETKGGVTRTGIENERRQWAAIMAEADARLSANLSAIHEELSRSRNDRSGPQFAEDDDRQRQALTTVARLDDAAFRLRQSLERTQSRALHVQRANRQLRKAYEADPAAGTPTERDIAEALVDASTQYLQHLERILPEERSLIDECEMAALAIRGRLSSEKVARERITAAQRQREAEKAQQKAPAVPTGKAPAPPSPTPPSRESGASRPGAAPAPAQPPAPPAEKHPPMSEAARMAAIRAMQERSRGR